MTVVKELNELAKKMTGVNPGAKTDAQALNYIEQNYTGGGEVKTYIIDPKVDSYDYEEITDTEAVNQLKEIYQIYKDGKTADVSLKTSWFNYVLSSFRMSGTTMILYFNDGEYYIRTSDGETFAIVQTEKSKFDYVIPAGLYEDLAGEITNEDIISVLERIDDNYLDADGKIKPLTIGIYLGNKDQSKEGYFSSCAQIGAIGGHVTLSFISNVDYSCMVVIYYDIGWKIGSSAI